MTIINWIKYKLQRVREPIRKNKPFVLTIGNKIDFSRAIKNPDGSSTISLTDTHPSIMKSKLGDRNFEESEAIQWLIDNRHISMIFNEIFSNKNNQIQYGTEIDEPFTVKGIKPGDIDIFAFQHNNLAVGIECKLIKFDFEKQIANPEDISRAFNKINGIDTGWEQLEGYRRLGFHKTYLLLIILDDQSGNKAPGQLLRKIDKTLVTQLKNLLPDNDTGVMIMYLSQITEYNVEVQNLVRFDLIREAKTNEQSPALTQQIIKNEHLFNHKMKL